jgi:hypothetical protein
MSFFGFSEWDIADGLQQSPVVEPVDPFKRGIFDRFKGSPWSSPVDYLGLVKAVDRLSQCVVIAVAAAADRRFDPGLGKALGVSDRDILAAVIAVMDQSATMNRTPPLVSALLETKLRVCQNRENNNRVISRSCPYSLHPVSGPPQYCHSLPSANDDLSNVGPANRKQPLQASEEPLKLTADPLSGNLRLFARPHAQIVRLALSHLEVDLGETHGHSTMYGIDPRLYGVDQAHIIPAAAKVILLNHFNIDV